MANQIGSFFETMPDETQATREVALHIQKFWEPRMRSQLARHLAEEDGRGLKDIVRRACMEHGESWR